MKVSATTILAAAVGMAMLLMQSANVLAQVENPTSQAQVIRSGSDVDDSENDNGLMWLVKALDGFGENFAITGDTLRSNFRENRVQLPDGADRVLDNIGSVARTGDKVVITNEASMTVKALARLDKTVSFTVISIEGKPALRDIKGISVGLGFLRKRITSYGP